MRFSHYTITRLFVFSVMTWPVVVLLSMPAFAASQNGPFLVTDRVDSYAIAGQGLASHQNAVLGVGYGLTQSNGVVGVTNGSMSYGVQGIASAVNGASSFGVVGSSANGNGIYGYSTNPTWAGIYATNQASNGVALQAASDGTATVSSSGTADGIFGETQASLLSLTGYFAGVHGVSYATLGQGMLGETQSGIGVHGVAHGGGRGGGFGVEGSSINGVGVFADGFTALDAESEGPTAGFFHSALGCPTCQEPTLLVTRDKAPLSTGSWPVIQAALNTTVPNNNILTLYQSGDLYISGKLVENQGSMAAIRTRIGTTVGMYESHSSRPIVEDVGEAQLTRGEATVKLDPTFSGTMDANASYVVFVSPEGDSKQLYVFDRSLTSFHVRESAAGHSSVSFAYRIVGTAIGSSLSARLPDLSVDHEYVASQSHNNIAVQKTILRPRGTNFSAPPRPTSVKILPTLPTLRF